MRIGTWTCAGMLALALGCGGRATDEKVSGALVSLGESSLALRINKSDFVDAEWFISQTVVDIPFGSARTFEGFKSRLEKIRWEITQEYLIAYRSYELRPGSDPEATEPGYHEEPVVMYPIAEHVGEPGQPWSARSLMRVDLQDQLGNTLWQGLNPFEGTSFTVEDRDDEDGFTFEVFQPDSVAPSKRDDYSEGELYYADFTSRVTVDASNRSPVDCTNSLPGPSVYELGVRTSLLRVPNQPDYEPVIYDSFDFNKFGIFRNWRASYDRFFGLTLSGEEHLAQRHNIWNDIWQTAEDGRPLVDPQGRPVPRPFSERALAPIAYYLARTMPTELEGANQRSIDYWNEAMRTAVSVAQQVELSEVPDMVVLCHNPVEAEDSETCGAQGQIVRRGDVRYNLLDYVEKPQLCGPLGYGPSQTDPESGEILSSASTLYGAAFERYVQTSLEFVQLINGDLTIPGLQSGEDVVSAVLSRRGGNAAMQDLGASGLELLSIDASTQLPRPSRTEIDPNRLAQVRERLAAMGAELPARSDRDPASAVDQSEACTLNSDDLHDAVLGLAKTFAGRTDYENVRAELMDHVFASVVNHEIGHTLGLRHNFAASADYLNYRDEFWEQKTAGVLGIDPTTGQRAVVPFTREIFSPADIHALALPTEEQLDARMPEVATSSVMDYHAQFNLRGEGLSHYDLAALVYSYTTGRDSTVTEEATQGERFNEQQRGYVETFEEVGDALPLFQQFASAFAPTETRLVESVHYHTLMNYMASEGADALALESPNLSDPDSATALMRSRLKSRSFVRYEDLGTRVEVPYLFATDNLVDTKPIVHRYDYGADPLEQVFSSLDLYRAFYPMHYFARDRTGFSSLGATSRTLRNTLLPLQDSFHHLVLAPDALDPKLQTSRTLAGLVALNALGEAAATTPNYGSYRLEGDRYEHYSFDVEASAPLTLSPGAGRRFERNLSFYPGAADSDSFVELEAGFDRTSQVAQQMLAGVLSSGILTPSGLQSLTGAPYRVLEQPVEAFFNALITQDNDPIGPWVLSEEYEPVELLQRHLFAFDLGDGEYLDPETFGTAAPPIGSPLPDEPPPRLSVVQGEEQRQRAALYAMALLESRGSGLHFQDQARIYREDEAEQPASTEEDPSIRFCDPASDVCYLAASGTGLAVQLLEQAQELQSLLEDEDPENDATARRELEQNLSTIELLRTLHGVFGAD